MNYFKIRLENIKKQMDIYIDSNISIIKRIYVYLDLFLSIVIDGATIDEYFQYKFINKRRSERKRFFLGRNRKKLVKKMNNLSMKEFLDDKVKFNKKFSDIIGRDWLSIRRANLQEFKLFIEKHEKIFVKPFVGRYGLGTRIESISESVDSEELYEKLKNEDVLLEEVINQNNELRSFNPSSVNTIRIVTLMKYSGDIEVTTATFRCGNGLDKFADNFHHGGIAAVIDVGRGIVVSKGVDRFNNTYVVHPISNKKIVGFEIPNWDSMVSQVKQAAKYIPEIKYIGWDVTLNSDNKVVVVEGNYAADPDVSQMPDQIGKWSLYCEELENYKANR